MFQNIREQLPLQFCPQVVLRIRPLSDAELEEGATVIAHKMGDQVRLGLEAGVQLTPSG